MGQRNRSWVSPLSPRYNIHSIYDNDFDGPLIYGEFSNRIAYNELYEINNLEEIWKDLTFFKVEELFHFKKEGAAANVIWPIVLISPKLSRIEISMADVPQYDRGNNPNFGNKPGIHSYKEPLLQKNFFEPLSNLKQLERLKIISPDTSQAFINYLSQFPNLKVLEWVGEYRGVDFSSLMNVDTLILSRKVLRKKAVLAKCELKLPEHLKMLILPKDSLGWILPALLEHPNTLSYLEVNYDRTPLFLLKDKVEHLILSTNPLDDKTFPLLANSMLKSLVMKINTYTYSRDHLYGPIMSIDSNFSGFKQLKELDLSSYSRVDLSPKIQPLKQLEKLKLRTNELPNSIIHWESLKELDLSGEELKNIPIGLARSKGLETLKISSLKIKKFPKLIYQLKNLRTLSLIDYERFPKYQPQFGGIIPDSLAQLKKLRHLEINLNAIKSRAHLRNIYKALPDSAVIELYDFDFRTPIKTTVNLGVYAQYNIGGTVMSGLEFNFLYNPFKIASRSTKKGHLGDNAYRENPFSTNPFDFHTFTAGVEWNYLKSFVMGYKLGYTYTRKRFPIAFQADLTAYTDYKGSFDLRFTPQIGIPIKASFAYIYLMYGYKIPLIPNQELNLIPRHTISLTVRIVSEWPTPGFAFIGW
jgi:hypothetical protein